jgi:hypothetical protein
MIILVDRTDNIVFYDYMSDSKSTGHWAPCRLYLITLLSLSYLQLLQVFLLYVHYQQQTIHCITFNTHMQLCVLFYRTPPINSNVFVIKNTNYTANWKYPNFHRAFISLQT